MAVQRNALSRLDQLLARLGYVTRSGVRDFLDTHAVSVDNTHERDPARKVRGTSVLVDGVALEFPDGLIVSLHKPAGYICTHDNTEGPTVYSLLPQQWMRRNPKPSTVGRLDRDASGLIIITDSTALVHEMTSPRCTVLPSGGTAWGSCRKGIMRSTLPGDCCRFCPGSPAKIATTECIFFVLPVENTAP